MLGENKLDLIGSVHSEIMWAVSLTSYPECIGILQRLGVQPWWKLYLKGMSSKHWLDWKWIFYRETGTDKHSAWYNGTHACSVFKAQPCIPYQEYTDQNSLYFIQFFREVHSRRELHWDSVETLRNCSGCPASGVPKLFHQITFTDFCSHLLDRKMKSLKPSVWFMALFSSE